MCILLITEELSFWANALTGTILMELGLLSNMESLYLYSNQLIGTVPTNLASLPLSKSQSLLFQYKIQFLHYGFSCVCAHSPHYRGTVPLWQLSDWESWCLLWYWLWMGLVCGKHLWTTWWDYLHMLQCLLLSPTLQLWRMLHRAHLSALDPFVLHFLHTNISEKHSTEQYDSNIRMLSNAETNVLSTRTSQSSVASDATPVHGRDWAIKYHVDIRASLPWMTRKRAGITPAHVPQSRHQFQADAHQWHPACASHSHTAVLLNQSILSTAT